MVTYEKFQKDMLAVRKLMGRKPLEPRKQIKISESNYKKLLSVSGKTFDEKISSILLKSGDDIAKSDLEKTNFKVMPNHLLDAYILLVMRDKAEWKRSEIVEEVLSRISVQMDHELFEDYFKQAKEMTRSKFHFQLDNRLKAMLRSGEVIRAESSEAIRNQGFIYKLFVRERILDEAVDFFTERRLMNPPSLEEPQHSYSERIFKIGKK